MAGRAPRTFKNHRPIKAAVITLLVIAAAAAVFAAALFFGLQKNIAYTDEGRLYLDIPWLEEYMDHDIPPQDAP